uniref:RING-type domain-containing protein n=1 Tax=Rhabditophanes sp. KR3021 TaxID=114890 RepID=A0AC35TFP9_9BILA
MLSQLFTCPICLDLLLLPTIIQCGHTFCKSCISDALTLNENCCLCRKKSHGHLISNSNLQAIIEHLLESGGSLNGISFDLYQQKKKESIEEMKLKNSARLVIFELLNESKDSCFELVQLRSLFTKHQSKLPPFTDKLLDAVRKEIFYNNGSYLSVKDVDDNIIVTRNNK